MKEKEKLLSFSRDIHCICRQMLDLKKSRILRQTMQKHVEQFEKWIFSISSEIEELIQSLNEASSFVVQQTVFYLHSGACHNHHHHHHHRVIFGIKELSSQQMLWHFALSSSNRSRHYTGASRKLHADGLQASGMMEINIWLRLRENFA